MRHRFAFVSPLGRCRMGTPRRESKPILSRSIAISPSYQVISPYLMVMFRQTIKLFRHTSWLCFAKLSGYFAIPHVVISPSFMVISPNHLSCFRRALWSFRQTTCRAFAELPNGISFANSCHVLLLPSYVGRDQLI